MDQVIKLAAVAASAGAHGLVCSPEEVSVLRRLYPNMTLVTPGIRSPGKDAGDQKRIGTPKAAMDNGSSNLAMGRQFFDAEDPATEVERVLTQELGIQV
jgi:orotidine-5'-phosphate decarboxylase